ncbi:sulfurtransferase TusA family protein [Nocardioides limicola]|uniref:sulfurtransferase TusA family protein n=1 Tax=Nocardioides limicola TaxID=2803368 RepID=UPI00193B998B|nr:sulfurtransferase TusA family protein [Nocardioides sp. DJM-14]
MADDIALELDCTDLRCPLPVIELGRRISDVEVGHLIAVVTADPAARIDVPAWCRMRAQEYVGEDATAAGVARYVVRRLV